MSNKNIYHYTYRITNLVEHKHYYGKRTSKVHPKLDLGIEYFSSSTDKAFLRDQKDHPANYRYKVIRILETSKKALIFEIYLHNMFDVGTNLKFYNQAKQTSTGFDRTGILHSVESKLKMSSSMTGVKHTTEQNNAKSIRQTGRILQPYGPHTAEQNSAKSIRQTGKIKGPSGPERSAAQSLRQTGTTHKKHKKHKSTPHKPRTAEHSAAQSLGQIGKLWTEERKANWSALIIARNKASKLLKGE